MLREVTPLVDSVEIDNMGNVTAIKKGREDKKVMIGAHMDEIAFMVTHIDEDGFLRFHTLGGFDPKTLTAQRDRSRQERSCGCNGFKAHPCYESEDRNKPPKIQDYFIDLGMTKEEVDKHIEVGNVVTRERKLIEMGDCVNCKSIDNQCPFSSRLRP